MRSGNTSSQLRLLYEHAETAAHRKKVERSFDIIRKALTMGQRPYVSISGGKDSTVVMELLKEAGAKVRRIHHDDEFTLNETREYLLSINNLETLRTEARHTEWFVTNKGFDELTTLDCDLAFMGLRVSENSYRKKYIGRYGPIHVTKIEVIHCNPIAYWSIHDVWAYILSKQVMYNAAYDVMTEKGIPLERQRIGPFANDKAIGHGQLQILKRCFPADFNRFVSQYPKARAYV